MADWIRLARDTAAGQRKLKIESTIGGYTSGGRPVGKPLVMVSVVNPKSVPVQITGAALSVEGGGLIPFFFSRMDMPPLPRVLTETEEHVFVMDVDLCVAALRASQPPAKLSQVLVYTTTGTFRRAISKTLHSMEEAW